MAPDAPDPVFDSFGNLVAEWYIRCSYDALRDSIVVTLHQEPGPYTRGAHEEHLFDPVDVEDAVALVQRTSRIYGARRLF